MTPGERRTVTGGIGTVVVAVMALRVAPAGVRAVNRMEEETAAQVALVSRARVELAGRDALADSVRRAQAFVDRLTGRSLRGATEDEALLDLRRRVAQAVETVEGVMVQGLDDGAPPPPDEVVPRIRMTARLQTDVRGLTDVLRAMERDSALTVSRLRVTAASPEARQDEPETLSVEIEVEGWYLTGAESGAGAPAAGDAS